MIPTIPTSLAEVSQEKLSLGVIENWSVSIFGSSKAIKTPWFINVYHEVNRLDG